jgi:hypothetical protein
LFDVAADKKGIMSPQDFCKNFEERVRTPRFLGISNWTRGYVARVRAGEVPGITFEGVVAKKGDRHQIVRSKAKTQAWISKVIEVHGEMAARKILES